MVDLDPVSAVGAVDEQQLGILSHRAPGIHVALVQLLTAVGAFRTDLKPLVAGDVLTPHQCSSASASAVAPPRADGVAFAPGGGGGSQPGFGADASPPGAPAAIAARASSVRASRARSG